MPDNGTDPSRLRRLTQVSFEHLDAAAGDARSTVELIGATPVLRHIALEATVPFVSTATGGIRGVGDVALEVDQILGRTGSSAHLLCGELTFDTATHSSLGAGMSTFRATYLYTRYLGPTSLAPSLSQRISIGGGPDGSFVNETTLNLDFVPTARHARDFVTMDVALTSDWERRHSSAELALSGGRVIGAWLGAGAQLYVRPRVSIGAERGAGWAIEAGSKLIGFGSSSGAGPAPRAGSGS